MNHLQLMGAALAACAILSPATAAVPLVDDFTAPEINAGRWNEGETLRLVDGRGRLNMARWSFGSTTADTGVTVDQLALNATDSAPATSMKVSMAVEDTDRIDGCAANPTPSLARIRMIGGFFSTRSGGPVAGDQTGDVLAQVQLRRFSNSTDAAGVVRAIGSVVQCTNSTCSTVNSLTPSPGYIDFGTATIGQWVTFQIDWDRLGNKFSFSRDAGTPVDVTYTVRRTGVPAVPFNQLSLRNEVANCTAGRVKAGLSGLFDRFGLAH